MRVLVACEFSGVVRDAFRARGHDAVSCDLLPSERPGPHVVGDVRDLFADGWDLMIAHPPCTFLANSGAKHLYLGCRRENGAAGDRWANLGHAAAFFLDMLPGADPAHRGREPDHARARAAALRHPGAVADDPAVAVRASRDQGDLPVAEGLPRLVPTALSRGGRRGCTGAARTGPLAEPEPNLRGIAAAMAEQWASPETDQLHWLRTR